jgi:hypothetical protein
MAVNIRIRLGPLAEIEARGANCSEIAEQFRGWHELNKVVEDLCGDLAERMYPDMEGPEKPEHHPHHPEHDDKGGGT